MNKTALIFGAGKTGRGFAAHLAYLSGYDIILVDNDAQLIDDISQTLQYNIQVLGNEEMNCTIPVSGAYHIDDRLWQDQFIKSDLVFTAVFGNNLKTLSQHLVMVLHQRYHHKPEKLLTIITCENFTNAAGFLQKMIMEELGEKEQRWLIQKIGFSEAMIFKTCLEAAADQPALTIRAQNYFELPCDGEAIKGDLHLYGLKPLAQFGNQLRRKIYTYNCINAVITYLGARKGYQQLYEAANDQTIVEIARKAGQESCAAQVAEFGFDNKEQAEWMDAAFAKFADSNVPDPIERNGADPIRKLGRDDRLIGPALLALKHNIYPDGLLQGILACFDYNDPVGNFKVYDLINQNGLETVLKDICGLSENEKLSMLIREKLTPTIRYENN